MQIMIISRHTERSRVWKGVLVVVPPSSYRCLGDGDTGPIGVKLCMVWYILVPDTKYSLLGGRYPEAAGIFFGNFGLSASHLTANISKTVSRSVTSSELNSSSTRAF